MVIEEMQTEDEARTAGRDHVTVHMDGSHVGFRGIGKTSICLQRCPKCGRENYAMAVLSGQCCWCGFNANSPDADA